MNSGADAKPVDRPDVLIVGGGIAGLYTAREILKRRPATQLLLIEKYPVLGGRVLSFKKQLGAQAVGWEAGAGRLHYSQKRIHALLDEYDITVVPLPASADYLPDCDLPRRQDNNFSILAAAILPLLTALPVAELQMQTLADVCRRIMGAEQATAFFNKFPYHTEVHRLRADLALDTFTAVMGHEKGFCTVRGGFAQIPVAIAADVRRAGGTIWLGASLERWSSGTGGLKATVNLSRADGTDRTVPIYPKKMILALHAGALQAFPQTRSWAPLRHLGVARLLRIYAVFPQQNLCDSTTGPWFAGMSKVVTPGPLRYVIPINEAAGTIMISYTDGDDTAPFWEVAQATDSAGAAGIAATKRLTKLIMTHVRRLFGHSVPNPLYLKAHPWTVGSTYWKPGRYNIDKVIKESRQLQPSVFVIGESFSKEQAWIEGALESAEGFLKDNISKL